VNPKSARITGVVGQVKWGYYNAAAINGYTVVRNLHGRWSVSGQVVISDAFKMSQRPLFFVAPHQKGEWRWPMETWRVSEGRLTADLGMPIE
jgi:hypothetical protein